MKSQLNEYEKISYDDFVKLPARPPKKPGMYSDEGVLNANKKVTAVVMQYLKENPSIDSVNFEGWKIRDYISKKISGYASISALDSIERKYKSLDLYFQYLLRAIKEKKIRK